MLDKHHRMVSFAIVFAFTGHLLPAFMAMRGSTLPNRLEESVLSPTWSLNHRKGTHYWLFYTLPICGCALMLGHFLLYLPQEVIIRAWTFNRDIFLICMVLYTTLWFFMGAILHIAEDFFCGTIPGLSIKHRIGVQLFRLGAPKEYFYAYLLSFLLMVGRCFIDVPYSYGL